MEVKDGSEENGAGELEPVPAQNGEGTVKKVGVLEEAAQRAEDLALDLISDLVSRGIPFELARERGLGRFIYLPQEPEPLSPDQMPLMPQQTT
jgi:hypothetical protein